MENAEDRSKLRRFLAAQDPVIGQVLEALKSGRKRGHWMWFVFPQLAGPGSSAMAQRYAIERDRLRLNHSWFNLRRESPSQTQLSCSSKDEARAYLAEPVLRARLLECTRLANAVEGRSAREIFGSPDDLKFRSPMTLFHAAAPELDEFSEALARYFGNEGDWATIRKLASR